MFTLSHALMLPQKPACKTLQSEDGAAGAAEAASDSMELVVAGPPELDVREEYTVGELLQVWRGCDTGPFLACTESLLFFDH